MNKTQRKRSDISTGIKKVRFSHIPKVNEETEMTAQSCNIGEIKGKDS